MEFDEKYIERRRKTFEVKVSPARHQDMPGELSLEITHNGYQWNVLSLAPEEAEKVILALSGALKR